MQPTSKSQRQEILVYPLSQMEPLVRLIFSGVSGEEGGANMNRSSSKAHVVIIGAGYAGMHAALRLYGKTKAHDIRVTLINTSQSFVVRTRLHELAVNRKKKTQLIPELLRGKDVRFIQESVTALVPDERKVEIAGHDPVIYDYMLYAPGSYADKDKLPGLRAYAHTLNSEADTDHLRRRLLVANSVNQRILVIGGGLTGISIAAEIAETYPHHHVMLVSRGTLGHQASMKARTYLEKALARLHIDVLSNRDIKCLKEHEAYTHSGERIPYDICIWTGPPTVSSLAQEAGLRTNQRGQMLVDGFMRSISYPMIYGVGDAAVPTEDYPIPIRMFGATAMPMAAQAVDNIIARLNKKPERPLGFRYVYWGISLGRRDALFQWLDAEGAPIDRIVTGQMAVWLTAISSRYGAWMINFERWWPNVYRWPGQNRQVKWTAPNESF